MTLPTRAVSIVRLGTLATANSQEAFFGGAFDAGALSGIFDGALDGNDSMRYEEARSTMPLRKKTSGRSIASVYIGLSKGPR